ncbi:MAG: hypothetical protein VR65_26970 [Desulfobulbaceae bacterium BRH_c16a]|nr:MAG: hypothetical protein VR65_26970 [Desulfobulbaceae bacterium BRH_c16a]
MAFPGLKTVAKSCFFLSWFCLLWVYTISCQAGEGIAPARSISVVSSESTAPEWKALWDQARNLARKKAYVEAASLYATLFQLKPNIEEASWEYCKVLLAIEDYTAVKKIVSSLLEKNPNRSEYLLAGGHIAVQSEDWTLAVKYYGKVLEKDPAGKLADAALTGLIKSLQAQGKSKAAFTLLEQLITRNPRQANVLREGALAAQSLGYADKARKLYGQLLAVQEVDDQTLLAAAHAFDSPGYEQQSSGLWAEYVERHPDYLPFHRKLSEYHLKAENFTAAIPHISYLAEHSENNEDLLLQAGNIYLYQLRRPDRALSFFERYLTKHPEDVAVQQKIKNIQFILADDFLAIVENDGAWLLWKDLAKVTPNRAAVFLAMADLLEQKGMVKALIEVLTIIHHHFPDDDALSLRLADQYYNIENFELAFSYLQKVRNQEKKTKAYFIRRGNIEKTLGMEMAALASFEEALRAEPGDKKLRKTCLEFAGKIGLAGKVESLFEQGPRDESGRPDRDLFLTYLAQLSRNFLFKQYEQAGSRYTAQFGPDLHLVDQMDLMKSAALRREGKNRKAEQLLRRMLTEGRSVKEVLFALVDNAIGDRNFSAAQTWYTTLVRHSVVEGPEFSHDEDGYQRLLRKVRILRYLKEFETARDLILTYDKERQEKLLVDNNRQFPEALGNELCWLNYRIGDYKETLKMVQSQNEHRKLDPELYILNRLLIRKLKLPESTGKDLEKRLAINGNPTLGGMLDIIDSELGYELYDMVDSHLQTVRKNCPESVIGNMFSVRFFLAKGKFDKAVDLLTRLIDTFPDEPYFTRKLIEIEVKRGRYARGIEVLGESVGGVSDIDTLAAKVSSTQDTEEILLLARLLWGDKQQQEALRIYEQLLSPPVHKLLSDTFQKEELTLYLNRDRSFWDSMMLLLQSEPEVVAELMDPEFLVNNLANEAGSIVAAHYEMYSWQKMISNEYLARKAIYERNYSSAEKSYKRLLEEEKTAEGMIDLAAVYGRTGKYRKEAQVYEAIQNTGATSPELVSSIERSSIQMSPQNIFDVGYEEREGRSGFIDISKLNVGTSFWFTPALDKDIHLAYSNNRYESINSSGTVVSNSLYGSAIYEFAKDYELIFGGGTEKLEGTSDARFLYNMLVKGQLDQYFNAYLGWQKSLVYDTVMAIEEDISSQGVETGLVCETPLGISFGGDFRHLNYSDGNSQNRFHGFSSYGLYGEAVHVSLRYDFQYLSNTDANPELGLTGIAEETPQENIFYWSPESFSEHLLTLHFRHDFLGYQQGRKRGVSYYSIDNAFGSEADEILSYMGKFDIFLEMNPHFLLKGNFTFAKSDDFEEKGLSLSLHYRW